MLLAPPKQPEQRWEPVLGAQVLFAPIDRATLRRARRAALKTLDKPPEDEASDRGDEDAANQLEELGDALSHALLMATILDWRDVAVPKNGNEAEQVLACNDETKALLLSDPVIFDAMDTVQVLPFVTRTREKNASAVSPNGIGEAATQDSNIASSPARPIASGAKGVRTAGTRSKRRKPKTSGTS